MKACIHKCPICIRYSGSSRAQMMSDLPLSRVTPEPPFHRTGVDYAGPVAVRLSKTRGRGTLKGYVAIFVCMVTRAIHLEIVEDYSSEAFINAFHRFTSRRGHCSQLFSDNGTSLVGADRQLRDMFTESSEYYKQNVFSLAKSSTSWHFIPPASPHFGGLWEAAVRSMKRHLRRVIGDQILTFVEYSTLLCKIEACLNSRPLIPLSDDASELEPLTPAHFDVVKSVSQQAMGVSLKWLNIFGVAGPPSTWPPFNFATSGNAHLSLYRLETSLLSKTRSLHPANGPWAGSWKFIQARMGS